MGKSQSFSSARGSGFLFCVYFIYTWRLLAGGILLFLFVLFAITLFWKAEYLHFPDNVTSYFYYETTIKKGDRIEIKSNGRNFTVKVLADIEKPANLLIYGYDGIYKYAVPREKGIKQ